jgi:hypothetical protein
MFTATAGVEYVYDAEAFDEDGDNLTFSLVASVPGMTIDQKNGRVSWVPTVLQKGQHSIAITVSDGRGGAADQPYMLTVLVKPPTCTIVNPARDQVVKGVLVLNGTAKKGALDVKSVQFRVDGGSWFTANGTSSWNYHLDTKSLSNGQHTIDAKALDQLTESNVTSVDFVVNNPPPITPTEYKTYVEAFPWLAVALILSAACSVVVIDSWRYKKDRPNQGPQD